MVLRIMIMKNEGKEVKEKLDHEEKREKKRRKKKI